MAFVLELNRRIRNNYVFFDPETPLHLSVVHPRGKASRITPSIMRALKGSTIIDVDGVIDLNTGDFIKGYKKEKQKPATGATGQFVDRIGLTDDSQTRKADSEKYVDSFIKEINDANKADAKVAKSVTKTSVSKTKSK
jgi:hypothetical protein